MPIINRIADFHPDLTAWRHDIHAHPETAFEEHRTAEFVATRLAEFGIKVHRGLAGTGVVGTLEGSAPGKRAIALRADMDALHVHEKNGFEHASRNVGKMSRTGSSPSSPSSPSMACITGPASRSASSPCAPAR
jgi:metal-dependent amidase/aminoacylase/carboxypeptidase family protein